MWIIKGATLIKGQRLFKAQYLLGEIQYLLSPSIGQKFNLHHLLLIYMGFKMAVVTLKLGISYYVFYFCMHTCYMRIIVTFNKSLVSVMLTLLISVLILLTTSVFFARSLRPEKSICFFLKFIHFLKKSAI